MGTNHYIIILVITLVGFLIVKKVSSSVYNEDFKVKGSDQYNRNIEDVMMNASANLNIDKDDEENV